jgi:hypothetical protein
MVGIEWGIRDDNGYLGMGMETNGRSGIGTVKGEFLTVVWYHGVVSNKWL